MNTPTTAAGDAGAFDHAAAGAVEELVRRVADLSWPDQVTHHKDGRLVMVKIRDRRQEMTRAFNVEMLTGSRAYLDGAACGFVAEWRRSVRPPRIVAALCGHDAEVGAEPWDTDESTRNRACPACRAGRARELLQASLASDQVPVLFVGGPWHGNVQLMPRSPPSTLTARHAMRNSGAEVCTSYRFAVVRNGAGESRLVYLHDSVADGEPLALPY